MKQILYMLIIFLYSVKPFAIKNEKYQSIKRMQGIVSPVVKSDFYIKSGGYNSEEVRDTKYAYLLKELKKKHKIKKELIKSVQDLETFGLI